MIRPSPRYGCVRERTVDPFSEGDRRYFGLNRAQPLVDRLDLALDFPRQRVLGEMGLELGQLVGFDRVVDTGL